MLEININNQLIDLGKDFTSVNLFLKSPFLTNQAAHSFPLQIPNNEHNRSVTGLYNYKHNYNVKTLFDAWVRFNAFRIEGYVNIIDVNDDVIELHYTGWETVIFDKIKKLKLTDLPYIISYEYGDLVASIQSPLNFIYSAIPVDVSTKDNIEHETVPWNKYIVNYPRDNGPGEMTIDNILPGNPAENYYTHIAAEVSPFFFLTYVIDKVYEYLGINIVENVLKTDDDFKYLMVLYMCQKWNGGGSGSITFQYNLPSISINEFINELEDRLLIRFCLNPFQKSLKIVKRTDIIFSTNKKDINDKLEGEVHQSLINKANFALRQESINEDNFFSSSDFPDTYAEEEFIANEKEVKIKSTSAINHEVDYSAIKTVELGGTDYYYFRKFNCLKIGYSINKDTLNTKPFGDFPWRLVFIKNENETSRRRINSVTGEQIAVPAEQLVVGTYKLGKSLKWEDSGIGIYDLFYKPYLHWINNFAKPTTFKANFKSHDLVNFDFLQKYNGDNMDFLFEEIPITAYKHKLEVGKPKVVTT